MLAVSLLPIVLGILVAWGGYLGLAERLPRSRGAGVRTAATLRSDEAFRLANKAAAMPTVAGGVAGVLVGAASMALPGTLATILLAALGLIATVVLVGIGGMLGNRAAERVPAPEPAFSPCGGCDGAACLTGATTPESCQS